MIRLCFVAGSLARSRNIFNSAKGSPQNSLKFHSQNAADAACGDSFGAFRHPAPTRNRFAVIAALMCREKKGDLFTRPSSSSSNMQSGNHGFGRPTASGQQGPTLLRFFCLRGNYDKWCKMFSENIFFSFRLSLCSIQLINVFRIRPFLPNRDILVFCAFRAAVSIR